MKHKMLKIIYFVLKKYAKKVIDTHKPIVIMITGSVGKTSTKEAIYHVLRSEFGDDVRATSGNLNSEIGVPLTILGYTKTPKVLAWPFFLFLSYFRTKVNRYPKYLILEIGVDKPGDMKYFASFVKPDYAIVTSVTPAHQANFKTLEDYQQEKLSLLTYLNKDGQAIVNYDDAVLSSLSNENMVGIGIKSDRADYRADQVKVSLTGTEYRMISTGRKISVKSKQFGNSMVYAQLFAFAIADIMKMNLINISRIIEKIQPTPGRMNVIDGKNNITIIDDTYNANPSSVKAALDVLAEINHTGRKVAVLGNMNELGEMEKTAHIEIGKYAKERCDYTVFIGPNAKMMEKGFDDANCSTFSSRSDFELRIWDILRKDDLVLVKASQNGNYFEEIVKIIMKNPTEAENLLVRQGRAWRNRK